MAFVVIHDANVLYPSLLRDVLIRVAQRGMVRARWTVFQFWQSKLTPLVNLAQRCSKDGGKGPRF